MNVTGCDDCPLTQADPHTADLLCGHPDHAPEKREASTVYGRALPEDGWPPDWCPLRTAPLTIALASQQAELRERVQTTHLGGISWEGGGETVSFADLGLRRKG